MSHTAHIEVNRWPSDSGNKPTLLVQRLRALGLDDEEILSVQATIDNTCNHCWDAGNGCQCWNDE